MRGSGRSSFALLRAVAFIGFCLHLVSLGCSDKPDPAEKAGKAADSKRQSEVRSLWEEACGHQVRLAVRAGDLQGRDPDDLLRECVEELMPDDLGKAERKARRILATNTYKKASTAAASSKHLPATVDTVEVKRPSTDYGKACIHQVGLKRKAALSLGVRMPDDQVSKYVDRCTGKLTSMDPDQGASVSRCVLDARTVQDIDECYDPPERASDSPAGPDPIDSSPTDDLIPDVP